MDYEQMKKFIADNFTQIQNRIFDKIDCVATDNEILKEENEKLKKGKRATDVLDVFIPFLNNIENIIMQASCDSEVQANYKEFKKFLLRQLNDKGIRVLDFPKGENIDNIPEHFISITPTPVNNKEEAGLIVETTEIGYYIPEENYIKQAYVIVGAYQEPKKTSPAQITQVCNNSSKENAEKYPYVHLDERKDSRMNSVVTRPVERSVDINDKEGNVPIKIVKKDADNTVWNGAIFAYRNNTQEKVLKRFNDSQYNGDFCNAEISAFYIYDNIKPMSVKIPYKCESDFGYHWEVLQEKGEIYFLIYPIKEFSKNSCCWEKMEEKRIRKGTQKIKIF